MNMKVSQSVVHVGSQSSHGGIVTSASGNFSINGLTASVNGDLHSCPIPGHGITPVTSASGIHSGGKSVLTVGCVAGCGAIITTGSLDVISA